MSIFNVVLCGAMTRGKKNKKKKDGEKTYYECITSSSINQFIEINRNILNLWVSLEQNKLSTVEVYLDSTVQSEGHNRL